MIRHGAPLIELVVHRVEAGGSQFKAGEFIPID